MRLAEGDEVTTEGMLAAKCAHLPFTVVAWLTFADHLTADLSFSP